VSRQNTRGTWKPVDRANMVDMVVVYVNSSAAGEGAVNSSAAGEEEAVNSSAAGEGVVNSSAAGEEPAVDEDAVQMMAQG